METLKVNKYRAIPKGFTGIAEWHFRKIWFLNGKPHRTDGPAIIYPNRKEWWCDGKYHRTDGPAIEWDDGDKVWYLNNICIYLFPNIGEYIVIESGLPSETEWLGEKVPNLKILTGEGIKYIPKLPGL